MEFGDAGGKQELWPSGIGASYWWLHLVQIR